MTSRLVLAPWLIAALLLGPAGCAYNSADKPIRLYPDQEAAVVHRVEKGGVYVTAVRPETGAIRSWRAVEIEAAPGDLLGLREEDGAVYAIVGSRQERLGAMPDGARYVCWATREYRMGVSSGPSRVVVGGVEAVGAVTLLAVAGVGALALVLAATLADDDDDDEHRW